MCPEISECSAKMLDLRIRIFKLHLLLMQSHAAVTYATLTKVLLKLLLAILQDHTPAGYVQAPYTSIAGLSLDLLGAYTSPAPRVCSPLVVRV